MHVSFVVFFLAFLLFLQCETVVSIDLRDTDALVDIWDENVVPMLNEKQKLRKTFETVNTYPNLI